MALLRAPLLLIGARARRRPGRWLLIGLGIGLAVTFGGAVAAEGVIAGDQSARSVLLALPAADRAVRVSWQGPVTPDVRRQATELLRSLGLTRETEVDLLNPVRLSGIVVRAAAIEPLAPWITTTARSPGPCKAAACPVLAVGGSVGVRSTLAASGVRLSIAGTAALRSAAPLGFTPALGGVQPPLLVTDDVPGLDSLAGLNGIYRSHAWLAPLAIAQLHSWQLAELQRRLQLAQATLLASDGQFTISAPFAALAAAQSQAAAAMRQLLLVGGGAIAAFGVFIVLAAGALRRDQRAELSRLRAAGARTGQRVAFVVGESSLVCGIPVLVGGAAAIAVSAVLAVACGLPAGAVLGQSLVSPAGAAALAGGWTCATSLAAVTVLSGAGRLADLLALAALVVLVAALALAGSGGTLDSSRLAGLLAPLCCLAAGVLVWRVAGAALRVAERAARRGPIVVRVALVTLARAPSSPALAIAFIAVSVALGAFALAYRATLLRGTSDQAAQQVPLDATVSPTASFATPLQLAPLARWDALSGGDALPVRRTVATFTDGDATVTVPALGVPVSALTQLRGWRASDGSAPIATLAGRLREPGPVRAPGPLVPPEAHWLAVPVTAGGLGATVTADLRAPDGTIDQLLLGNAAAGGSLLRARLPPGAWELEAFELDQPIGVEATSGHQNAENPAASAQSDTIVKLGPALALGRSRRPLLIAPLGAWRAVGSASVVAGTRGTTDSPGAASGATNDQLVVSFVQDGLPGIVRPRQPSDVRAVPVLVDPQTDAAATRSGRIALTIDGLPVDARIVGVVSRFPTVDPDAGGLVVADEATLASALDAQLPGQGRADELWIATRRPARLRAALASGPLAQLGVQFRAAIEHRLRSAPIARAVLGTLLAATALSGVLAVLGMLVALVGDARDQQLEEDLAAQGLGPHTLRVQLRLRLLSVALAGVAVGLGIGVLLTRLAVATVQAAGTVAVPQPPLVTVAPSAQLALWGAVAMLALVLACVLGTSSLTRGSFDGHGRGRHRRRSQATGTKGRRSVA
jgi:hypothetical protein